MAQVVIIGAGLTGLSAAYHLEKKGFFDYTLFEKEATPGGLCRSVRKKGFTFDYTGHLLHSNNPTVLALLEKLSAALPLIQAERHSHIYSYNTLTPYPYQQQLYGLPPQVIADCIEGFVTRTKNARPRSFTTWVNTHFGSGFGTHFFFPYQQKLFAYELEKVTASWTGRFVPSTSLRQLITGAVSQLPSTDVGYNARFVYPAAGGIDQLIMALTKTLAFPPLTHHTVHEIDTAQKKITFTNGQTEYYQSLISTMPLNQLLATISNSGTPAIKRLKKAENSLHCNSVINVNLGIAHPVRPRAHWIYYPEKAYPFYRIGFPALLAPSMAPTGHSSLSIEISQYKPSHPVAQAPDINHSQELIDTAVAQAKKLFQFTDEDILTHTVLHLPHAYVIYDQWRDKNLEGLLTTLAQHDIYSIGRYGGWHYSSMQEAILAGAQIIPKALLSTQKQPHSYMPAVVLENNPKKERALRHNKKQISMQ